MNNYMKTIISGLKQWVSSQKSDWNQNDSSAANFIKNKPFYSEEKEKVLFSSDATSRDGFILSQPLVGGTTYTVVFNGVTYKCLAREYDGYIMIGNNAIYEYDNGVETDTGEPFAFECSSGNTSVWVYFSESVTEAPSVTISTTVEVVHQIDKKYVPIPDMPDLADVAYSGNYYDLVDAPDVPWDTVRYASSQTLTDGNKKIARNNIGASSATNLENGLSSNSLRSTTSDENIGSYAVALGYGVEASSDYSFAEGRNTKACGVAAHAEGDITVASGQMSHAEGWRTLAFNSYTHAEGRDGAAFGVGSHVEGEGSRVPLNMTGAANAVEYSTNTVDTSSYLNGKFAYNDKIFTIVGTSGSNVTLDKTMSSSSAIDAVTVFVYNHYASGLSSHAEGVGTIADSKMQHVQGQYNIVDSEDKYSHIVGNGFTNNHRSNAHTLDWDGLGWFAGGLKVGGTSQDDPNAVEVALKSDLASAGVTVDSALSDTSTNPVQNKVVSAAINNLNTLVGDTSVSEQINDALASKSDSNHNHNDTYYTKNEVDEDFQDKIYKQNEAPTDAEEGALWLDMDEETIVGGGMNGITVDSTLSSTSTNPVQNKVVNAAINNLNTLVGDKSVSVQINEALTKFSGGGNVAQNTIIDVISLPTENINKSVLYRVLKGTLVYDSNVLETSCFVVDGLPKTGEPVTTDGQSINAAYYNVADNDVYGYLTAEVAAMAGVPSGWYPFATLAPVFNVGWMGVIGDIMDSETDGESYALLLEGDLWYYTYDWKLLGPIGSAGTGIMAETFNHPGNVASGMYAHAEGRKTVASDLTSHAEGHTTTASGGCSHAEGSSTTASGDWSHAEGADTTASGLASHAEGVRTTASSEYSHAEGYHTTASGYASHAEGGSTTASEPYSHAEGNGTTASGFASHAEGEGTIASSNYQHVQGICNIEDSNNKYLHIVGNGSNVDILKYSNAHTLDWNGNAWFAGDVYVGSTSGTNRDSGSKKLVTDNELRSYAQPIGDYVLVEHVEPLVPTNAAPGNVVIVEGVYDDSTIASSFSSIDLFEEKYSAASMILAERTFSNDDIMVDGIDSAFSVREYVPNFIVGETYFVLWNDETYMCEAYDNGDVVCIGNGMNEPFMFARVPDEFFTELGAYLICVPFTDLGVDGAYTVSIFDSSTEYRIKDEYLPENIDLPDYAKTSDLDSKMSSENPVGTGSFSMNRKPDTTIGDYSHAEGYNTTASGNASHAEGNKTIASGTHSHAEGFNTTADGFYSHAEGYNTTTGSTCSHAEGYGTTASGSYSHAEGYGTIASISASHAEGWNTIASSNYQHVQGKYNIKDSDNKYAHIVGNGSNNVDMDIVTRSNAHTLDWDGNAWFAGKIKVGGTGYDDANAVEVVLKSDLVNNGTFTPSDWNANEGEAGHILNRPFYSEYKDVTLLETTTLTASGSFGGVDGVGFLTSLLDVNDGMECIVIYNGTTYNCTARATTFNDIPCCILGNSYAFGDENTGEPFLVCAFSEFVASQVGIYGGVIPLDGSGSFSISVIAHIEDITPIPAKYLGSVRGQKPVVINLDTLTVNGNIKDFEGMDAAEIQAVTTAVYKGKHYGVQLSGIEEVEYSGTILAYYNFFLFAVDAGTSAPIAISFRCNALGAVTLFDSNEFQIPPRYNGNPTTQEMHFLVRHPAGGSITWRSEKALFLNAIYLKSPTGYFKVIVDDSGNLTTVKVSMSGDAVT